MLGRVFGLKDPLDAVALCAAFVGGALIASHSDARVVFAISGAMALIVALVSTGLLLRAGVVGRLRIQIRVRPSGGRAPRLGGLVAAPAELGETGR